MSPEFAGRALGLVVWGGVLAGTLSIANWPGNWGHGVCGPWGCGPPLQALAGCHISWLVVLLPLGLLLRRSIAPMGTRWIGNAAIMLAVLLLLGTVLYERFEWWPVASDYQRAYFWNRVGFVIITRIELPALELLLFGIVVRVHRFP